jgi:glycosyltransferase involved in cell wall biosynthesis
MPLSILQVITDTDRRGAQVFAMDLHEALAARGCEMVTVALAPGKVGGLDVPVLGPGRRSISTMRALRSCMTSTQITVAHGSTTLPACAIASVGTRAAFVYRQISDLRFWASSPARRFRVRVALARAAGVVALWEGSASLLSSGFGVRASRVTVIPNGVPPQRFPPADARRRAEARAEFGLRGEDRVAVYVGALVPEKGVDVAIDAVALVPGLELLVAGGGPERRALEERAASVAPGRVRFAGSLADPTAAYASADVIVLPSRGGDSMPATLIEAGMMGIPAVATPVEAIPEIVRDGVTGALVGIGSPDELAGALRDVTSDGARMRALGASAREHCLAHYSIGHVADAWSARLIGLTATPARR